MAYLPSNSKQKKRTKIITVVFTFAVLYDVYSNYGRDGAI